MDHIPGNLGVHDVVTMNQNIPKVDDPTAVTDSGCHRRIEFRKPVDCLTDDLELSLDCRAEHSIFDIMLGCAAGSELANECCGLSYILQEFPGFKPHREECGCG